MKKIKFVAVLLCIVMLLLAVTGCVDNQSSAESKWDAMVTYKTLKPKFVGITYVNMLSSVMPLAHFLDSDDIPDFINFLKESKVSFDEFGVTDDDKASVFDKYYTVHMAYYSGDDYNNAADKIDLLFAVGLNGHIYFDPSDMREKETIIRSTEPIDLDRIIEFYNQAKGD